jgi:hypothetical protein
VLRLGGRPCGREGEGPGWGFGFGLGIWIGVGSSLGGRLLADSGCGLRDDSFINNWLLTRSGILDPHIVVHLLRNRFLNNRLLNNWLLNRLLLHLRRVDGHPHL